MLLFEIFSQSVDFDIIRNDDQTLIAEFTVNGYQYIVGTGKTSIIPEPNSQLPDHIKSVWSFGFKPKEASTEQEASSILNRGNASIIFSTAIEFLKYAIERKQIQALSIKAKADQPTRIKLYRRMVNTIASKHDWKIADIGDDQDKYIWYVYKEKE